MDSAPPPPKKARTDSNESASYARDDAVSPKSFLDSFPNEILENVLRFFSRQPKANDWVPHIPLGSIIELYSVTGQLSEFMIPRFNTLCVSNSLKYISEREFRQWKKRKGPMLCTNDIDVARRFVLAVGGKSLSTIIVGFGMYSDDLGAKIADDFLRNCPNVKSLCIEDKRGDWVSRFGRQLEHLDIITESTAAIAKNCTNLRELNLCSELFQDDVEIDGIDIWEQMGRNLECLTLNCMYKEVEYIANIKTHCRNLRRICIYDIERLREGFNQEISSLLVSYGDQLEYCHVEEMNESQLTAVSKACKNARFSTKVSGSNLIISTLKVLGQQLDKIAVICPEDPLDVGELTIAWNGCVNVRELEVYNCGINHAKAIVATPKEHVEVLEIILHFDVDEKEVKRILDKFSEGLVGVERIQYFGAHISGDAFDKLISRNKSSLREFKISFGSEISFEKMDTYLPIFLKCSGLEVVRSEVISKNMLETLIRCGIQSHNRSSIPRYSQ